MTAPMLDTLGLTLGLEGRQLVADLTLSVQRGETIALLGRNGSGKTLTLLTLAGLRTPVAGQLHWQGAKAASLPRREAARHIGFLPQDPGSELTGTVFDFAALGLFARTGARAGADRDSDTVTVLDALNRVGLGELHARQTASLSGGERRRLDLALLLVQAAPLWLLDEPNNHLDPAQQSVLLDLLRTHRAAGGAAIVSLHDPGLAVQMADRALLLHGDGRWELGAVGELLTPDRLSALYGTPMTIAPRITPLVH